MSILNVNKINPVGGGSTVTIAGIASVTNSISAGAASFSGDVSIADKIVHTGDTNTAIRFPANDQVSIETAGSEALRITNDGRLGVGIAAPTKLLDIATATSADGIRVKSTGNTYNELSFDANRTSDGTHIGRIISHWNGTAVSYISMDAGSDTTNKDDGMIRFWTAADGNGNYERLRIHSNGLVTAPFQYHLHAERSSNQTGYNAQGDFGVPMIFNQIVSETKDSSLNSCFNTSTGVFTAPVLGLYIFNASVLSSGNNVFSQSWFTLNGSRAAATDWHNGQTSHSITQNTQVIRLAAGNTVGFKPYASGQSSLTLNSNSNHTYLKVTLIG